MSTSTSTSTIRTLLGVKRLSKKTNLEDMAMSIAVAIENGRYEGEYPSSLYAACYGIIHGFQTGRVDGSRYQVLRNLVGKTAADFIISIADKKLSGDDVSRFLNGRPFQKTDFGWKPVY